MDAVLEEAGIKFVNGFPVTMGVDQKDVGCVG
jgi:hypothetical protein